MAVWSYMWHSTERENTSGAVTPTVNGMRWLMLLDTPASGVQNSQSCEKYYVTRFLMSGFMSWTIYIYTLFGQMYGHTKHYKLHWSNIMLVQLFKKPQCVQHSCREDGYRFLVTVLLMAIRFIPTLCSCWHGWQSPWIKHLPAHFPHFALD